MPSKDTSGYLGVYGGTVLTKAWCEHCEAFSFVRHGVISCCDERIGDRAKPTRWKRESLASGKRAIPSRMYQEAQRQRQGERCFYCLLKFGEIVTWRKRVWFLKVCWDHLVPFIYLQTNPLENFVAACQICNAVKHAKVFQTVEEARQYVSSHRALS